MKPRLEIVPVSIRQTPLSSRVVYFLDVIRDDPRGFTSKPVRDNITSGTQTECERVRDMILKGDIPEWKHVTGFSI